MRIKLLFLILTLGIVLSATSPVAAQEQAPPIQAPETIEEAQEFGLQILTAIPGAIKEVWKTQAVPLWTKMWQTTENLWNTYVFPWLYGWWEQFLSVFGQEIEKRKPLIEEEFQRKKEELKQEIEEKIPEPGKTLWEHIKGFLPGQ